MNEKNEKNGKNGNEEKKSTEKFEPAKLDKVELSKEERKDVAGGSHSPHNTRDCRKNERCPYDWNCPENENCIVVCPVDGIMPCIADICPCDGMCFADYCYVDDGSCPDDVG